MTSLRTLARYSAALCLELAAACSDGSGGAVARGEGGDGTGGGSAGGSDISADGAGDGAAGSDTTAPPARLMRYLSGVSDRSLRIELDSVPGLEPYAGSISYVRDKFAALLEKPDGITLEADEALAPAGGAFEWSFEQLDDYARSHARDDSAGPVTIQVLSLDGRYVGEGSATVLGLAWGQRFIALFQDSIRSSCASGVLGAVQAENCEIAERNVWAHEIGHVIGLVDNGVPMRSEHRDPDHGRHDVSDECLMYWAYDGPQIFDALLGRLNAGHSPDLEFCSQCQADLAAVR